MDNPGIRWQQRFASYQKALLQLQSAVELSQQHALNALASKHSNSRMN